MIHGIEAVMTNQRSSECTSDTCEAIVSASVFIMLVSFPTSGARAAATRGAPSAWPAAALTVGEPEKAQR